MPDQGDAMSETTGNAAGYGAKMLDVGVRNFTGLSQTAQAIVTESAEYTKASFESAAAAAEKLLAAPSMESAVRIQAEYGRAAYERFVAEGARLAALYADLAKQAYAPFESMVARPR